MTPTWRALFLGVAVAVFVITAWRDDRGRSKRFLHGGIALGAALATFPAFYDALQAAR